MRLYAWSGQRTDALSQYEKCVALLEEQLGVAPQENTSMLYSDIKAGRAPPPPDGEHTQKQEGFPDRPSDLPAQPPSFLAGEEPRERPLFGARERELAQLDEFLDLALSGQGRVVVVTGEAGSGKTALV